MTADRFDVRSAALPSATEAIAGVRRGDVDLVRLLSDAGSSVVTWEPELGAVTAWLDPPLVGSPGPLTGLLFGVKETMSVAGMSAGPRGPEALAAQHAEVIRRLLDEGATLVARLAAASLTAPGGITPQTRNPRHPTRVSGGSSGGPAAAVAAGIVHVALGTDAGGSIRIPASCCGLVGFKPTWGAVGGAGVQLDTSTLDAIGPIAASVADADIVFRAIAGPDVTNLHGGVEPFPGDGGSRRLRVGVPVEVLQAPLDADVRARWTEVLDLLAGDGALVREVTVSGLAGAGASARTIGSAEHAAVLAARYADATAPAIVLDRIRRGVHRSEAELAHSYHLARALASECRTLFEEVDVLITPTLPCRVPAATSPDDDPDIQVAGRPEPRSSALTRLVNPWNLAGLPAGTLPCGFDRDGGAVGVQVVGPRLGDLAVLAVMARVEGLVHRALERPNQPEKTKDKNT